MIAIMHSIIQMIYRLNKVLKKGGGELPFMNGYEFLQEEVTYWLDSRGRLYIRGRAHRRKSQGSMK